MKCIDQLKEIAAKVGATLDMGDGYCLNLDAPSGYYWSANGCTCLCEQSASNSQSWYSQAVREISERAAMGLDKVTDAAELADTRNLLDDDTWGVNLAPDAPQHIDWPK